jgi:hypothetical protein
LTVSIDVSLDDEVPWSQKDKDATPNYSFDLTPLLGGATLSGCTWAVTPAGGASVVLSSISGNVATVQVTGGVVNNWYSLTATYTTSDGQTDQFTFRLFIEPDAETVPQLGTLLFPNRYTAVANLRRDRLMLAAATVLPNLDLSDDYIFGMLVVAEAEIARRLRVPLVPTKFFPLQPTDDQINALNGMPWQIDPGYDYSANQFAGDSWGYIKLRHKPIISIDQIQFAYPAPQAGLFTIPSDWIRIDAKYGTLQLVPSAVTLSVPLSSLIMQAIAGGRTIPFMMQVTYTAGLANAAGDFPELLDVVQKQTVLKIMEDCFFPQSGSISADGLSQSLSVNMDNYRDTIDRIIDGPKGANGGLMSAIHGVRSMTLG